MFLSASRHSSELRIQKKKKKKKKKKKRIRHVANHCSRPKVSQLKCVSDTTSNWFENHQSQKTKISTDIFAPFIQNSNRMPSKLRATTSFPRVFFQLLQFSRKRPSFSAHRAALMTKTDLIFPAFSSRFVDFGVQFCFRCKFFLLHEERRSHQVWQPVWQWRDVSRPITILYFTQQPMKLLHFV